MVNSIFNREAFLASLKTLVEGLRGRMPIVYTLITPLSQAYQSGWSLLSMMRSFASTDPAELPVFMQKARPKARFQQP